MNGKVLTNEMMKKLREDINLALEVLVGQDAPLVKIEAMNASFDASNGYFTFQLKGVVHGGQSPEVARYLKCGPTFVRPLPPLGSQLKIKDKVYTITGLNSAMTKVIASHPSISSEVLIPVAMANDPQYLVKQKVKL